MPEFVDQAAPATHRFPPVPPEQIPAQRRPLPVPPPAPRRSRRWPWVVAVIAALFVGIAIGSAGKASPSTSAPAAAPVGSSSVPAPVGTAPPVIAVPAPVVAAPAPVQAAPAGPATSMGSGTYEVGVDIAVGRYKTDGPDMTGVMPVCGWSRNRDDSGEFSAIIANGIVGGPGSVSVKKGEFLELTGDCNWVRQ